jgi:hypothetical protein
MGGELRPTLFPSLGIRVGDVSIGNPDWVDAGPLIAAERLDVSVEWAPLLRGEIRLDRAEFVAPRITLVRAADGRVSWDFAGADTPPAPHERVGGNGATPRPALPGRLRPRRDQRRRAALDRRGGVADDHGDRPRRRAVAARRGPRAPRWRPPPWSTGARWTSRFPSKASRPSWRDRCARLPPRCPGRGAGGVRGPPVADPRAGRDHQFEATDLGPLLALAGAAMPALPARRRARPDRGGRPGDADRCRFGPPPRRDGSLDDNEWIVALDLVPGATGR